MLEGYDSQLVLSMLGLKIFFLFGLSRDHFHAFYSLVVSEATLHLILEDRAKTRYTLNEFVGARLLRVLLYFVRPWEILQDDVPQIGLV